MKYKKGALIFPGQGSQYVGMGKEFDRFKLVRDIYLMKPVLCWDMTLPRNAWHLSHVGITAQSMPSEVVEDRGLRRLNVSDMIG